VYTFGSIFCTIPSATSRPRQRRTSSFVTPERRAKVVREIDTVPVFRSVHPRSSHQTDRAFGVSW
jgi:hypothetical protein